MSALSTGSRNASEITATVPTYSYCVTSSTWDDSYRVNVIYALDPVQIALMHRIHAHKPRLTPWIGSAALPDHHPTRARVIPCPAHGAIGARLAQVVQMSVGKPRQSLESGITIHRKLAAQHRSRAQTRHLLSNSSTFASSRMSDCV